MSASAPRSRFASLGYVGKTNRYDECVDTDGNLRGLWKPFFDFLGDTPDLKLYTATEACHRAILEQDVSMNVYLGQHSGAQPWPLDAVPLLIAADERHSRGLCVARGARCDGAG